MCFDSNPKHDYVMTFKKVNVIFGLFFFLQTQDSEEAETQEGKPYGEKRKTGSEENAQQWKELMLNAVSEREKAEQEKQVGLRCFWLALQYL